MTHRTFFGLLGAINIHRFVFRDIEQQFVNEVDRIETFNVFDKSVNDWS